jgi:heterodisulfide reductase subunit A
MSIKIGFYICHCGINIAYRVRVKEVTSYIRDMKNVVISRDYKFMCSDPGQEMIEKDIRELGLTRVVVASCTPRIHEKTFQNVCTRAGLNPYFFQMASVREQVSWVTENEDQATRKAKNLSAAAVSRVNYHESLFSKEVDVHPDVLVVGGGIAGMQASLDIAASGHKVYLVEKNSTIGGHMLRFDKTFPTLDCAACIGTPKMVEVIQHPGIELLSYSEVKEVNGYIGNYKVKVHRKPRYVNEDLCTGCGECVTVCPVTRPNEWDVGLMDRTAIYRSFPQAVPITFVVDKKGTAPCKATCPAHVSVQGFVALTGKGKFDEALKLFKQEHPFPASCGRVCHHPCEEICTRGELDDPLAVSHLHRFIGDLDLEKSDPYIPETGEKRNEKIAIIGSGPAGLTCAYFLVQKGYGVTVFEKLPVAGGMMAVGIPDYRLPGDVLDREIEIITKMGVEIKVNTPLGPEMTIDSLLEDGYSSVFLATGAHIGVDVGIPGEYLDNVVQGVKYLRELNISGSTSTGKNVGVIGGGNVAFDVARSAVRLGAEKVSIIYRRTRKEMPAWEEEIRSAEKEGIVIIYLTSPKEILGNDGSVIALRVIKMEMGEPDKSGRARPVPVENSEYEIPFDQIIPAIGQRPDITSFEKVKDIKMSKWGTTVVDPLTLETGKKSVFAGGDLVYGPKSVVDAVECGKDAAETIHRFIKGVDLRENREKELSFYKPDIVNIPEQLRTPILSGDPKISINNFNETTSGYNEEDAIIESERCLSCGVCCECYQCVEKCEAGAIDHSMKPLDIEIDVGSIIVATGFDLMDPTPIKQFGYGKYKNVFTSFEFERLSNATGPTGGEILIRDEHNKFTKSPRSVALLHCVGSRDVNYHQYCSRVCCMYALKYSHLIKEKIGKDTEVYDFYIDQRCFGKGYEEFYQRCQSEGTHFIRGKVAEITDRAEGPAEEGKLIAIAEDTLLGSVIRVPVDMVVLCLAMEAKKDATEVGRIFGINQGADGFFLEEHPKLAPLNTPTDGVFIAGTCQAPKDIPDTVAQASGAAAKALALATIGKVRVSPTISFIDPDICIGCQICIGLCPYTAIEFDNRRSVSFINEALCKGCGSCSGFCPSGAAQVRHFNSRQIFAELDGIFDSLKTVGL